MSKIPKWGASPLLYMVEESRGHAWRPLGAGTLDQREALVMLDAQVSSYTRRVVQVVAVRLPGEVGFWTSPAGAIKKALAPLLTAVDPEYAVHSGHCCVVHGCKYGDDDCPVVAGKMDGNSNCLDCAEYGPGRYAGEDFPRPRGVTP